MRRSTSRSTRKGFTLYGPISSSHLGCTAGIHGDATAGFAAWRATMLETGWKVIRDDTEVVTVRGGVRLTLYLEQGLPMLNATTTTADECEDGRSTTYDDGQVGLC